MDGHWRWWELQISEAVIEKLRRPSLVVLIRGTNRQWNKRKYPVNAEFQPLLLTPVRKLRTLRISITADCEPRGQPVIPSLPGKCPLKWCAW